MISNLIYKQERLNSVQKPVGHPHFRSYGHDKTMHSYDDRGSFTSYTLHGYDTPDPELYVDRPAPFCDALNHGFEIGVQTSWHMEDDLWQIAGSLSDHPMVKYHSEQVEGRFDLRTLVKDSWARLATACVLLPKDDVYLCITRVVFHAEGSRDHGRASFIRGQVFNKHWIHLDNYQLRWRSQTITFPRIFNVPFDFDREGLWYGPEDARIVIEHDVEDCEPVIVFNMIGSKSDWNRGMWILRPFSLHMVLLTIRSSDRTGAEKNWTPFFLHKSSDTRPAQSQRRPPSTYIYFVRSFGPLEVLKCSLVDGTCDSLFLQTTVKEPEDSMDGYSYLRGGTQFEPIPLGSLVGQASAVGVYDYQGLQAYIALPRTNTGGTKYCQEPFYRPHLAIMITDGTNFAMTYGSEPIDFGPDKVIDQASLDDPCGTGRIMIPNGIADWDYKATTRGEKTDIMTIQVSVNDATVQSLRLSGILSSIGNLHSIRRMLGDPTGFFNTSASNSELYSETSDHIPYSTQGIRKCMEDAARQYIEVHTSSEIKKTVDLAEKEKTEMEQQEQEVEEEGPEERLEEEEKNDYGEWNDQVGDSENDEETNDED